MIGGRWTVGVDNLSAYICVHLRLDCSHCLCVRSRLRSLTPAKENVLAVIG